MEEGFDFTKQYKEQSNELKAAIRSKVLDNADALIYKTVIVYSAEKEGEMEIEALSNCKNETVTILSMIENGLVRDEVLQQMVDLATTDIANVTDEHDAVAEEE